jgi:hypothetical protein
MKSSIPQLFYSVGIFASEIFLLDFPFKEVADPQ